MSHLHHPRHLHPLVHVHLHARLKQVLQHHHLLLLLHYPSHHVLLRLLYTLHCISHWNTHRTERLATLAPLPRSTTTSTPSTRNTLTFSTLLLLFLILNTIPISTTTHSPRTTLSFLFTIVTTISLFVCLGLWLVHLLAPGRLLHSRVLLALLTKRREVVLVQFSALVLVPRHLLLCLLLAHPLLVLGPTRILSLVAWLLDWLVFLVVHLFVMVSFLVTTIGVASLLILIVLVLVALAGVGSLRLSSSRHDKALYVSTIGICVDPTALQHILNALA